MCGMHCLALCMATDYTYYRCIHCITICCTQSNRGVQEDGVRVVRFDGGINFTNWENLVSHLRAITTKDVHSVVLDSSAITSLDSTAFHGIEELIKEYSGRGVRLLLASWKAPQREFLSRAGFYSAFPRDTIFLTLHDAVTFARTPASATSPADKDAKTIDEGTEDIAESGAGGKIWRVGYNRKEAAPAPAAS